LTVAQLHPIFGNVIMPILNALPMPLVLAAGAPNVFTYFGQSNLAGKVIIIALAVFSLLAWTVMIGKFMDLRRMRRINLSFERKLSKESRILSLDPKDPTFGRGPYAYLSSQAIQAFFRYGGNIQTKDKHTASLRMGHVENALQRAVAEQTIEYEAKMVMLGSIVTGAPFLGLLGTVWGVMDAFGSVTGQSSVSLQSLAPGVSGALLTTVAGLLVAIPSVFGYNYLLTLSKMLITELENFASTMADRIELESE
jgi:biopolymer transport protein TolQ